MSLPGVAWLFKHGLRWACQQLALHPRAVSLDLMPRGGLRPPPAGVLLLTLVRIEGLSGSGRNPLGSPDPYCLIQVVEAEEEQEEEEELDVGGRLVNGGGGGGGGAAGGGGASRRQTASSAATGQQQQQSRTTAVKPRARLQRQSQQQPAQRSATVANSRDPVYGQQFALLLRHPLECQVLRIEVSHRVLVRQWVLPPHFVRSSELRYYRLA